MSQDIPDARTHGSWVRAAALTRSLVGGARRRGAAGRSHRPGRRHAAADGV